MESIKIGILGMGNVAKGLYKTLEINEKKIEGYLGKKIEVKKILVRSINKDREIDLPIERLTTDVQEIINDPEIQIAVELIGGIDPAFDYIKALIESGKHVVTANKAVVATYGNEIEDLAKKNGVKLRFEGSVGGGIPIINTLKDNLVANEIEEIVGIINGTTNFILTQMTDYGMSFEDALLIAQEKGYAEADPTSDLEGEDAAFKLSILSSVAFGKRANPNEIPREGIKKISQRDIQYASELGYNIKLLASGKRHNDDIELHVHPALIPKEHPLSAVKNEFNALFVRGNAVGDLMFYGKGAGSMPTGSAVLGDVLNIVKNFGLQESSVVTENKDTTINGNGGGLSKYYVRFEVIDQPGVLGRIAICFGDHGVSVESVVQRAKGGKTAPVVFITHEAEGKRIDEVLKEISTFSSVDEIASILKVKDI